MFVSEIESFMPIFHELLKNNFLHLSIFSVNEIENIQHDYTYKSIFAVVR